MGLEQLPFWAQLGVGAVVIGVLVIGAGTRRFGRIWVFGWAYDAMEKDRDEWKELAMRGMDTTRDVAEAARGHTILTREEADTALRVIREAGKTPSDDRGNAAPR